MANTGGSDLATEPRRHRGWSAVRTCIAATALAVLAGCGSSNESGSATTGASSEATAAAPTTAAPTTAAPTTGVPTTAAPTTESTTTEAPTTTASPADEPIEVIGDQPFVSHVEAALTLLEVRAPEWHAEVLESVDRIEFVEAGSGMDVYTRTFRVGRETAYAPGYGVEDQVEWLAGAIVHDACHSEEYIEGREWIGRDAELTCLMEQAESLALHEDGTVFFAYVSGLIDGIDDPANAYWNDPNRHW